MSQRVAAPVADALTASAAAPVPQDAPTPPASRSAVHHGKMWCRIESSLRNMTANPGSTSWRPNAAIIASAFPNAVSGQVSIRSVSIIKGESTFPVSLGISVEGFENHVHTQKGHRFATVLLPKERLATRETLVDYPDVERRSKFFDKFPGFSPSNLEKGVLDPADEPFKFVKADHPIADMLEQNSGAVDSPFDIDLARVRVGDYYKVSDRLFATCIAFMQAELADSVCVLDVNAFRIQLSRPNGEHFDSVGEVSLPPSHYTHPQPRPILTPPARSAMSSTSSRSPPSASSSAACASRTASISSWTSNTKSSDRAPLLPLYVQKVHH